MLKPLFIVLVLLFSLRLLGQHPYYYKIDDETGLPSNEVYELLQDDFGYVWIGCDAGLFRYDGFRFKGYTNAKQNGKSISYLRKDKKGRIWCKNFNGQIYRVEGDSLRIIIDNSGLESTISQFAIDENLELWVANCNIIECYDENGKNKKIIYEEKKTKNQSHFQEIICFNNYVYFTKSGIGLFRYNKQNGKVNFLSAGFVKSSIYTRFNFSVSSGRLFMIAEKFDQHVFTVFEVKDSLHKLDEYELKGENKRAYYLCFDRDEQPWLCTTNGAYKPDFGSAKLVDNNFLFQGEKISFMMQDKEGNYWFTSLHNGIFVVPDMNLIRKTTGNSTLTTNNVSAIKKLQNGSVLLGTYSGKLLLDKNGAIHPFADKFDDRYSTVKKIQETDEYILASRIFLSVIHKSTGREVLSCRLNARDFLIKEDTLFSVSSAAFSKIPVSGLVSADCDKVSIPRRVGGKALCSLPGDRHVYIGFTDGFYSYCDGKFEEITLNNDPIYVQHVAVHENEAWLVTSNRGVMKLTNGKIFPSGLDKLGIKEREVKALYSKEHYLFVVNNNLLYILNLKTQNVFAYSSITGINPKDITDLDYHNGIVYLATNKGMSTFPLNMKWYNDVQPPIKLDRVMLSDSLIPMDSIIHLTYRNNNLHIEFISVAFRSRGAFFYEYRLKELDTAWTLTKGSENYAVFSSLPPGKFTFEVRAVNENNVRSQRSASLIIMVDSPFWQKWWFYIVVILITAGIVALLFQLRIKVIRRTAQVKQDLTSSQLAAINAQMNPHFMYNTLNSIQDLILKSDVKNTNYYLSRFSSLMRKILEASQHNTIVLEEELEILELYLSLEKLRFGDEFTYTIQCDDSLDKERIMIPSIIIQPFVENAIKHGLLHKKGNKTIRIRFSLAENRLLCEITDNGIGRKRAMEIKERSPIKHKSFATQATEQRLVLINSTRERSIDLRILDLEENGEAKGTEVRLQIPL